MGRRKIEIKPLTDDRNRTVTFTKRKAGLFKKAHELSILCEVDVSVIIIGRNHKIYEYSSDKTSEVLDKYTRNQQNIYERKVPEDYGDYEQKSRILQGIGQVGNKKQHGYSNSLSIPNHVTHPNVNSHSRSQSDSLNNVAPKINTRRTRPVRASVKNSKPLMDDEEDEASDDQTDGETGDEITSDYDTVHDYQKSMDDGRVTKLERTSNEPYNDTTISLNPDLNNSTLLTSRKRRQGASSNTSRSPAADHRTPGEDRSESKKQKINNLTSDSLLPPETPDQQSDRRPSATVTPYYMRTRKKDGNSNMKRPALSLTIPAVEGENRQVLSDSTITALKSSNRSNQSQMSKGLSSIDSKKDNIEDEITKDNRASKRNVDINAGNNTTTDSTNTSNSSKNTSQQIPNQIMAHPQYGSNLVNSTPLASALFREKRNLYTPISSNFLNNMSLMGGNPVDTPVNYFNFNGMSPTQLLTPMFPLVPTASISANNDGVSDGNNGANITANNITSSNIRSDFGPRSNKRDSMNSMGHSLNQMQNQPPIHIPSHNQNQNQNQNSNQASQPFLPPMNSATSIYFPQVRMPNQRGTSSLHINTNYSSIGSFDGNKNIGNVHVNNNSNANTNANISYQGVNSNPMPISSTGVNNMELPSLSGEMSALPSRYVDFQSPNTMFSSHDWQLPTGTTPIGGPPILAHTFSGSGSGNILPPKMVNPTQSSSTLAMGANVITAAGTGAVTETTDANASTVKTEQAGDEQVKSGNSTKGDLKNDPSDDIK